MTNQLENITFAGVDLGETFGVYWDGSRIFNNSSRQIEIYPIPGRNGNLTFNMGRKENLAIQYNCFIKDNFLENYTNLMDFLNNTEGYQVLKTDDEPGYYRRAIYHASVDPQMNSFNQSGQFTLEFDCMPQLFLDAGEEEITLSTSNTAIENPTYSPAYPLLKVTGTGTITIGAYTIRLTANTSTTYIDIGEAIEAWEDNSGQIINRNPNLVINQDGVNIPGKTSVNVKLSSGMTGTLKGRFYKL